LHCHRSWKSCSANLKTSTTTNQRAFTCRTHHWYADIVRCYKLIMSDVLALHCDIANVIHTAKIPPNSKIWAHNGGLPRSKFRSRKPKKTSVEISGRACVRLWLRRLRVRNPSGTPLERHPPLTRPGQRLFLPPSYRQTFAYSSAPPETTMDAWPVDLCRRRPGAQARR
jgi:hypothetical protein